jgi:histidinol-phosphate aminotransferase
MKPVAAIADTAPYAVPQHGAPTDLWLAGNEGRAPDARLLAELGALDAEALRRYPHADELEAALATRYGVDRSQVLVTAGADDALDRVCRALLAPGRSIVLPVPTFEMIGRYAELCGATIRTVPWAGDYPLDAVLATLDATTAIVAVVSPNNPTGAVARAEVVERLSAAAPQALVLVDAAYGEFADDDLTAVALARANALVTRTFSKAWGLAGLRVGYALGPAAVIDWLRRAGHPYAVSSVSLALALARLDDEGPMRAYVARARRERDELRALLARHGLESPVSQANFVFLDDRRAPFLAEGLAGLGIAVRSWPGHPTLGHALRITLPGDEAAEARVAQAIETTLAPEALLFDMDGVLADVSRSYREAIRRTAVSFGIDVTAAQIAEAKARGDANNDWVLTERLIAAHGVEAPFEAVKARFEALYQGDGDEPGLWQRESLLCDRALLERLAARLPLGIVTGRPRHDATRFLAQMSLSDLFGTVICMEDAPLKPDPAPVRAALEALGVQRAWLVGDTPDDVRAARAAGVLPLGYNASVTALVGAGAARVLESLDDLETLLP